MKRIVVEFAEMELIAKRLMVMGSQAKATMRIMFGKKEHGKHVSCLYQVTSLQQQLSGVFYALKPSTWSVQDGIFLDFAVHVRIFLDVVAGLTAYKSDFIFEEKNGKISIGIPKKARLPIPVLAPEEVIDSARINRDEVMFSVHVNTKNFISLKKKGACLTKKDDPNGMDNVLLRVLPKERTLEAYSADGTNFVWARTAIHTREDRLAEAIKSADNDSLKESLKKEKESILAAETMMNEHMVDFFKKKGQEDLTGCFSIPFGIMSSIESLVAGCDGFTMLCDGHRMAVETSDKRSGFLFCLGATIPGMLYGTKSKLASLFGIGCRIEVDNEEFIQAVNVMKKLLESQRKLSNSTESPIKVIIEKENTMILRSGENDSSGEVKVDVRGMDGFTKSISSFFSVNKILSGVSCMEKGNMVLRLSSGKEPCVVKNGTLSEGVDENSFSVFLPVAVPQKKVEPVQEKDFEAGSEKETEED